MGYYNVLARRVVSTCPTSWQLVATGVGSRITHAVRPFIHTRFGADALRRRQGRKHGGGGTACTRGGAGRSADRSPAGAVPRAVLLSARRFEQLRAGGADFRTVVGAPGGAGQRNGHGDRFVVV